MSHNLADSRLNLSAQSLSLLALLADTEPSQVGAVYNKEHDRYRLHTETGAWYNGRERGVWLQVSASGFDNCLNIVFCEARNSDQLVVQSWVSVNTYLNPPNSQVKGFEQAYQSGVYFKPYDIRAAYDYILNLIREHIKQ